MHIARATDIIFVVINRALQRNVARACQVGLHLSTIVKAHLDVARAYEIHTCPQSLHLPHVDIARTYQRHIDSIADNISKLDVARPVQRNIKVVGIHEVKAFEKSPDPRRVTPIKSGEVT